MAHYLKQFLASPERDQYRHSVRFNRIHFLVLLGAFTFLPVRAAPSLDAFTMAPVTLYGHPLDIYCARPAKTAGNPLVIYSTGDGGWKGLDRELLTRIAAWGYPVGGFDSGRYLKDLGYCDHPTSPDQVARDFGHVIAFTLHQLGMPPDTPVVLVGWSRGAGLSVVAAGQPELQRRLAGVVGVALTEAEENVVIHHKPRKGQPPGEAPRRELVEIDTYAYLPRLGDLPLAVLQSTQDGYVPADDARRLFGPDTDRRRLYPIESTGHSFSGGRSVLYQRLRQALAWVATLLSPDSQRVAN
jgi:fermentation-respiration switch protein FrsA (DUF1100 family)